MESAFDERRFRGRRSRVVLTPRRRRQVSRRFWSARPGWKNRNPLDDGDKKARSPGRSRRKPLKPLRAGMPGCFGGLVVTTLVWFIFFHARLRVHCAPGIPHALIWAKDMHNSGASRRGIAETHLNFHAVIARSGSDEAIHASYARQDGLLRLRSQ